MYEYPDWFIQFAEEYKTPQGFISKKDPQKPGFHIEYEIKPSTIGGNGLFVKNFVPKHSLIWKYSPGRNVKVFNSEKSAREYLSSLCEENQYEWISHVYSFDGVVNEICDDGKYWNHSENPNSGSGINNDWDSTYAKRDIEAGEVYSSQISSVISSIINYMNSCCFFCYVLFFVQIQ